MKSVLSKSVLFLIVIGTNHATSEARRARSLKDYALGLGQLPICSKLLKTCDDGIITPFRCVSAVKKYFQISQFRRDSVTKDGVRLKNFQYFADSVKKFHNDPKIDTFYLELIKRLQDPKPFNLWEYTIDREPAKSSMNPKKKAVEILAVLFQRSVLRNNSGKKRLV